MYSPLHASVPSLRAPGRRPTSGVAIGNEKATAATVALFGAIQRSLDNQNTSTKVLSVQGQSNQKSPKFTKLDSSFRKNGGSEHERGLTTLNIPQNTSIKYLIQPKGAVPKTGYTDV